MIKKTLLSFAAMVLLFFSGHGVVWGQQKSCAEMYPQGPQSLIDLCNKQRNQPISTNNESLLKPLCLEWTEKNEDSNKICTELLEGIPMAILKEGECYPPSGGKYSNSTLQQPENYKDEYCYAVITSTGLRSLEAYVGMVYRYAAWIIGVLGVMGIIIAGLRITIGSAVPSEVAAGKAMITKIIEGVILFFLIGAILRTLNPNFFISTTPETPQKTPIQAENGAM